MASRNSVKNKSSVMLRVSSLYLPLWTDYRSDLNYNGELTDQSFIYLKYISYNRCVFFEITAPATLNFSGLHLGHHLISRFGIKVGNDGRHVFDDQEFVTFSENSSISRMRGMNIRQ